MALPPIALPVDWRMENPGNWRTGEEHTLNSTTGRLFATDYGPFFTRNMAVYKVTSGGPQLLRPGIDYTAVHSLQGEEVRRLVGRGVCTIVRIDITDYTGKYLIDYHALGGLTSENARIIEQLLEERSQELNSIQWGNIAGKPLQFNPAPHVHNIAEDTYGWDELIASNMAIRDAILTGGLGATDAIMAYIDSKFQQSIQQITTAIAGHNSATTAHNASAIGLGNVPNLVGQATRKDAYLSTPDQLVTSTNFDLAVYGSYAGHVSNSVNASVLASSPMTVIPNAEIDGVEDRWMVFNYAFQREVVNNVIYSEPVAQTFVGTTTGVIFVRSRASRTTATWGSMKRVGGADKSNVPNYGVVSTGDVSNSGPLGPNTTVNDKFMTPISARILAGNVLGASKAGIVSLTGTPSGTASNFIESALLDAGATYLAVISGTFRKTSANLDTSSEAMLDNSGFKHIVASASGTPIADTSYAAGSFLGARSGSTYYPMPATAVIPFTAPTGNNTRVRFMLDCHPSTNVARGQVRSVHLFRIK